eukprot:3715808-Prymnesium_polylepis.4
MVIPAPLELQVFSARAGSLPSATLSRAPAFQHSSSSVIAAQLPLPVGYYAQLGIWLKVVHYGNVEGYAAEGFRLKRFRPN